MKPLVLIESPFGHPVLDETVQQVRQYLDGRHQVIDYGTVGLFRVYSVAEYPTWNDQHLSVKSLKSRHRTTWANVLSKPVKVGDYMDDRATAAPMYVNDIPEHPGLLAQLRANILAATKAIYSIGLPTQRDLLIIRSLAGHKNKITGGGVGGYAYRKTHAIEVDAESLRTPFGIDVVVHEWAHKYFFNQPQHVRRFVADWFDKNVANAPQLTRERADFGSTVQTQTITGAWDAFADSWAKDKGVRPDKYVALKRKAATVTRADDTDVYMSVFLEPGYIGEGTVKKGFRNPEGGEGIRKGEHVVFMSSNAIAPGSYQVIRLGEGDVESLHITTTADAIRQQVELDLDGSAIRNNLVTAELRSLVASLQRADDTRDADRVDNFFARPIGTELALSDAVFKASERATKRGFPMSSSELMSIEALSGFIDAWVAQAEKQGDAFDPRATFIELFNRFANWSAFDKPISLASAAGTRFRDALAKSGVTPSSYAAANVDELWAELLAYTAMQPAAVSKPLRKMLVDVMSGRAPGGSREKRDNAPPRYRNESLDEAAAAAPSFNLDGALGIPRERMPQIAGDDVESFVAWLRKDVGLSVRSGTRAVGNVKPTQDCVDPSKLGKMHDKSAAELAKHPLVISSDGYLLDGHHRWAVLVQRDASYKVDTLQVDCKMRELLRIAKRFDKSFTREYGESLEEGVDRHGNKRSHASRVRAYKKSGRMVSQTFATGASLGRSNTADAVIDYAREGDAAYGADKPQTSNPYERGTPQYGGWSNGWFAAWKLDYGNGSDAARRNKPRTSNPNDKGTNPHAAWLEGWERSTELNANESAPFVVIKRSPFA